MWATVCFAKGTSALVGTESPDTDFQDQVIYHDDNDKAFWSQKFGINVIKGAVTRDSM